MILFNPKTAVFDHLDDESRQIMRKTIAYFETRGKNRLKQDFHQRVWYQDFLAFLKENQIFATLLTPEKYAGDNPNADGIPEESVTLMRS